MMENDDIEKNYNQVDIKGKSTPTGFFPLSPYYMKTFLYSRAIVKFAIYKISAYFSFV